MLTVEDVPINDSKKQILIPTREFHGIKLYAFIPTTLEDVLMMFMGTQIQVDVICKERARRMALLVRPEDEENEVIEPNFAYTYPYEVFFTDGEVVFKLGKGRGIVHFKGYTYVAKYDNRDKGTTVVWMDKTRRQVNRYLDKINAREGANISVV